MADVEKLNINSTDYDIADAQARADILNKQDIMQVDTMPTASADNLGKIIQWIGGGNTYTDGYFYQCVSNGEPTPTYSWAQIDVQPAGSSETIQVSSLPTAGADELGNIYEYIGTTSGDLVHGDFYECVHDVVSESSLSVLTTGGPVILRFSVNKSTFESYVQPTGDTILNFQYNNSSPAFTWKILPDNTQVTLSDYGISITEGTPTSAPTQSEFRAIYTAVKDVYKWVKKNVTKDSLEILQNQSDPRLNSFIDSRINSASDVSETAESVIIGNNTRANGSQSVFIGNNITQSNPYGRCVAIGNNVSGGSTYNVTIGTGAIGSESSVVIGDGATAGSGKSVVIGSYRDNQGDTYKTGSTSVTIGDAAKPYKSTNSVVLGAGATITQANTARDVVIGQGATLAGSDSVAIGQGAVVNNSSAVAVGAKTQASQSTSVALGASAKATAEGAIQIGAGINSMPNTLKIGSYQLMNNSGVVPYERLSSDTPENGEVLQYSSTAGGAVWTDVSIPTASAATKGGVKVGNGLEISNAVLSTKIKVFDTYQNPDDYEAGTTAYFKSTGNGYIEPNSFYVATGRFAVNVSITSSTCTYDDVTINNDEFYNAISYLYENQTVPCYTALTIVIVSTATDFYIALNDREIHTQDMREWGLTFTNLQAEVGSTITMRMSYGGGTLSKNLWKKLFFVDVVDDLTSSNKYAALSANQGRMLKQMIDSKEDIGRFLALWDSNTGTARYLNTGFEYERGDYFIISNISVISLTPVYTSHGGRVHHIEVSDTEKWVRAFGDDNQTIRFVYSNNGWKYNGQYYDMQDLDITYQGAPITGDTMDITYTNGKNYKPDGATYTGASTTLATEDVQVSDMWFYDGEHWVYLENHERSMPIDDEMSATSENPVQNKVITATLNDYQLKLTAGNNIKIDQNNVISATGGSGVGVPEITDVFPIIMKDDSALPDEDFKSRYSPIYFSTNLTIEQLIENMNKQYVTVSRYAKNNRKTKGRARGKMSVMNDQRVKMDRRMYCYRYEDDTSHSVNNPQRYYYFYSDASTEAEGRSEDMSLYTSLGHNDVATLATNINCLADCGNTFNDYAQGKLERYEAGDIDTYINVNDKNAIAYHKFITGIYQCYEYEKDDKKYYIWEYEDSSIDNNHYIYEDNGNYVPEYIPDYFNQLTAVGPASFQGFTQGARRKDLDVKRFNYGDRNVTEFADALYNTTTVGSIGDTHVRWNCYWFDFPILPKLLAECKVFLPMKRNMSFSGKSYKLRDLKKLFDDNNLNYEDYFKQNGLVRLELPYDTYYLYMRICAWQKMCFANDEWTSRFDFPYAMSEGVFDKRGFGSPRGRTWRVNGTHTAINTYLEFNLAESDSVLSGKPSRSKPVKKRLTATTEKGKQTIRD